MSPQAEDIIQTGDTLLMMGNNEDIRHMEDKYERKR